MINRVIAEKAGNSGGQIEVKQMLLQEHVRALLEHCSPCPSALEIADWSLDGEEWAEHAAELIGMDPAEIGTKS